MTSFYELVLLSLDDLASQLAGRTVYGGEHPSPHGAFFILATSDHLLAVCYLDSSAESEPLTQYFKGKYQLTNIVENASVIQAWGQKILNHEPLPLLLGGTSFQLKVWRSLATLPAGKTTSYAEIAQAIGHPKAVRAVGSAVGANPISYCLPCHRVLCKDGSLGGYRWGLARKRHLLKDEGIPALS